MAYRQLALGDGVWVRNQTSGPAGEMLISDERAAVRFSKLSYLL